MTEDNSSNRMQGEFGLRGKRKDYLEYYSKIQMRSNSTFPFVTLPRKTGQCLLFALTAN